MGVSWPKGKNRANLYILFHMNGRGDILARAGCMFLALKAIKEAAGVVALLVATSVFEVIPARDAGGAVDPRLLPVERAVSSVPLTLVVVTLRVAHFIPRLILALEIRAGRPARYGHFVLAVAAGEVRGAAAAVQVRVGRVANAGAGVLAGRRARLLAFAVWPAKARLALAVELARR